jgi:prepilin-type processing-associated H-X9-DG protein
MILPLIDQPGVYNEINFAINIPDPPNLTARSRAIGVYLCPEDNMARLWTTANGELWVYHGTIYSAQLPLCDVAGSNYVGVFGIGEPGVDGEGVFYRNSFIRPIDIADGLTHTLCVGERATNLKASFGNAVNIGPPLTNIGRGQATWVGAVAGAQLWSCAPDPFDPDAGTCKREDGSGMTLGHTGEGHGPGDEHADVNQFLSRHGAGAHFVFCDGRVEYLRLGMSYATYKALSTRAWGEAISDGY